MFRAKVLSVEEKFQQVWLRGSGKDAKFLANPLGWFVCLEGSHEALYAGGSRPNIFPGDVATIRIDFHDPHP